MTNKSLVDFSRLKILCILEIPGGSVLTHTLKHGTHVTPPINFEDYLRNLPDTSTANYRLLSNKDRKKKINQQERNHFMADQSWDNFDITLLYKCIQLACEDVAGLYEDQKWQDQNTMEGLITKIKYERNICVHERRTLTEKEFNDKVTDLKDLFDKAVTAVGVKYGVPDSDTGNLKDTIHKEIRNIKESFSDKEILQMSFDKLLPLFKETTRKQLKDIYQKSLTIDPLYFLSGSPESRVNIQTIFSKVNLKKNNEKDEIDCLELLKVMQPARSSGNDLPQMIMISGAAGSGKTTLLTFILSEWLKDESDRCMKYLDDYEIVLQILCRERDGSSLQGLLDPMLPDIFAMYNDSLVRLLTKCKVLFLVDGLDESNESSEQLLYDILKIGRIVPHFTFICTSRPERVADFLATTRSNYCQWQMCMEGISPVDRTEFVLKHYKSLHDDFMNRDTLRQTIENIVWRDYFGLPLNLLFLATLCHDSPKSLRSSSTQSSLYLTIHEWCIEKLINRLALRPQRANTSRKVREVGIKKVLQTVYKMSLDRLLQGRTSLLDEDVMLLKEECEAEKLPIQEVMGAFFSLRSSTRKRIVCEEYYVPYKALQEFYAAQHIVSCIQHDQLPGDIRLLLPKSRFLTLQDMRNTLHHVAALLCNAEETPRQGAIDEVVDLLAEAGVKKCYEWLFLLEETEVNNAVLQRIAHHVSSNDLNDKLDITDSTVFSATALLPLIPGKEVEIKLQREPEDLSDLSRALNGHDYTRLYLEHHYKHPSPATTSATILRELPRHKLKVFLGQLRSDGIALLPEHLTILHLGVVGDHSAASVLTALAEARPALPRLEKLYIHIPLATVTPNAFTGAPALPDTVCCAYCGVRLVLTGMEESLMGVACAITAALQPRKMGYRYIKFPDSRMTLAQWRSFLNRLAKVNIKAFMGIIIPETTITNQEEDKLRDSLRKDKLKYSLVRSSEELLWWW